MGDSPVLAVTVDGDSNSGKEPVLGRVQAEQKKDSELDRIIKYFEKVELPGDSREACLRPHHPSLYWGHHQHLLELVWSGMGLHVGPWSTKSGRPLPLTPSSHFQYHWNVTQQTLDSQWH